MRLLFLMLANLSFLTTTSAQLKVEFPKSDHWVTDANDILTVDEEQKLEKFIAAYEKKTSREIAIVTVESYIPFENIADYTLALFNEWGIGKKQKDNGLLIVICKPARQIRITTGLGTEKVLTDEICKKILDEEMIPYIKKEEVYKALKTGIKKMIKAWK